MTKNLLSLTACLLTMCLTVRKDTNALAKAIFLNTLIATIVKSINQ
jgi:hypothetical protein